MRELWWGLRPRSFEEENVAFYWEKGREGNTEKEGEKEEGAL